MKNGAVKKARNRTMGPATGDPSAVRAAARKNDMEISGENG
jgi:hypothetical protein